MGIYEITPKGLQAHQPASYAALGIFERNDLQRVLREYISALGEELLVISEEFSQWEDARRRIDLLAIDKQAKLVVIELKRTEDGGHMELQALRYAAMVSSMAYADVLDAYERYLVRTHPDGQANAAGMLREYLGWADEDEPAISSDVRIILASAGFDREITTTVLWLNTFENMDIRCVELVPYKIDDRILIDVQQVVPLPEAADYQVRLRRKDAERDRAMVSAGARDYTKFEILEDGTPVGTFNKRTSILEMVKGLVTKGISPSAIREAMPLRESQRAWRVLEGIRTEESDVKMAIDLVQPRIDPTRWWLDCPFFEPTSNQTYVLSNQWGSETESTLSALADAFPHTGVSFRRAGDRVDYQGNSDSRSGQQWRD